MRGLARGTRSDTEAELDWMARKCLELRLFPDEEGGGERLQKSVQEIRGELLVISQFTLYGTGRSPPSFDRASALITPSGCMNSSLPSCGIRVETGQFGAIISVDSE